MEHKLGGEPDHVRERPRGQRRRHHQPRGTHPPLQRSSREDGAPGGVGRQPQDDEVVDQRRHRTASVDHDQDCQPDRHTDRSRHAAHAEGRTRPAPAAFTRLTTARCPASFRHAYAGVSPDANAKTRSERKFAGDPFRSEGRPVPLTTTARGRTCGGERRQAFSAVCLIAASVAGIPLRAASLRVRISASVVSPKRSWNPLTPLGKSSHDSVRRVPPFSSAIS